MKLLLLIVVALLLVVGIGSYSGYGDGQVLIEVAGSAIQTSFVFFLLLLIATFFLLHSLLKFITRLFKLSDYRKKWQQHRRHRLSEKYLTDGLMAMLVDDWKKAEAAFSKGAAYSQHPLVNYLVAAKTAHLAHNNHKTAAHLLKAGKYDDNDNDNAKTMTGLVKAELQLKQNPDQALETLLHLYPNTHKQAQAKIKNMLLYSYAALEDWQAILNLLAILTPNKLADEPVESQPLWQYYVGSLRQVISKLPTTLIPNQMLTYEQVKTQKIQAYAGLLSQADSADSTVQESIDSTQTLDYVWANIPKKLRAECSLLEIYTQKKLQISDTADCEPLLRKALKKQQNNQLIYLYGLIEGVNIMQQLKFAESLRSKNTDNAMLFLTLGRLSNKNELFGKAKKYLETSLAIEPLVETYLLLGTLSDRLGEPNKITAYYKQGLELAMQREQPNEADGEQSII